MSPHIWRRRINVFYVDKKLFNKYNSYNTPWSLCKMWEGLKCIRTCARHCEGGLRLLHWTVHLKPQFKAILTVWAYVKNKQYNINHIACSFCLRASAFSLFYAADLSVGVCIHNCVFAHDRLKYSLFLRKMYYFMSSKRINYPFTYTCSKSANCLHFISYLTQLHILNGFGLAASITWIQCMYNVWQQNQSQVALTGR